MIHTYDYSENMMNEVLRQVEEVWRCNAILVKDTYDAYMKGFSPRETRIRMEPFVLFLQECPTKARLYWNEDKNCWTFWRDSNA